MLRWRVIGVWWAVALAVAGGALLAGRGGDDAAATRVGLGIDAAGVTAVSARRGERSTGLERVEGLPWRWVVRRGEDAAWAADESRVRAGLRLLASASMDVRRADDAALSDATSVLIEGEHGAVMLRLGAEALGGVVPGVVERDGSSTAVWVARDLALALRPASLVAWGEAGVLAGVEGTAADVAVDVGGRAVRLRRGAGGWALVSPVAIEADAGAVGALLGGLGSLRASALVPVDDVGGRVLARIEIENGTAGGVSRTLELLERVPGQGGDVPGRVSMRTGGHEVSTGVRLDPASLNRIAVDARALVTRAAMSVPVSDVRGVRIGAWQTERASGGWRIAERPAESTEVRGIEALLGVLSDTASAVEFLSEAPADGVPVRVLGLSGAAVLECWASGDAQSVLIVRRVPGDRGDAFVAWRVANEQGAAIDAWLRSR